MTSTSAARQPRLSVIITSWWKHHRRGPAEGVRGGEARHGPFEQRLTFDLPQEGGRIHTRWGGGTKLQ